jgi:hypothetical protein
MNWEIYIPKAGESGALLHVHRIKVRIAKLKSTSYEYKNKSVTKEHN